jgi:ABC-type branched-subunit amino acid transport system substrate-binding protein
MKVGKDTYKIEVISRDDQYTGSLAATAATEFVSMGIHYVIGPIGTDQAVIPIFNDGKCFNITIGATWYGGPDKPYWINGSTYYPMWIAAYYAAAVEKHPEIDKVAVIGPDTESSHSQAKDAQNAATALGLNMVAEEYYVQGTTEFYPVMTKVLRSNPDTIDTGPSPAGDQALMVKAGRELGFKGRFLQPNWVPLDTLITTVGVNDLYSISTSLPDFSTQHYSDAMRTLNQRYMAEKAQPGETSMPDCVVHGYSQMMFYKKAIEAAGSIDTAKVMQVINDPNFAFERYYVPNAKLGGTQTFGINRQMPHFNPYSEIVIEGGQAKVVQMGGKAVNVP